MGAGKSIGMPVEFAKKVTAKTRGCSEPCKRENWPVMPRAVAEEQASRSNETEESAASSQGNGSALGSLGCSVLSYREVDAQE